MREPPSGAERWLRVGEALEHVQLANLLVEITHPVFTALALEAVALLREPGCFCRKVITLGSRKPVLGELIHLGSRRLVVDIHDPGVFGLHHAPAALGERRPIWIREATLDDQ